MPNLEVDRMHRDPAEQRTPPPVVGSVHVTLCVDVDVLVTGAECHSDTARAEMGCASYAEAWLSHILNDVEDADRIEIASSVEATQTRWRPAE